MKFSNPSADIFAPDPALNPEAALKRTTHLCVAAHQDDIEIMAYHGIAECFGNAEKWFSGVVVTNGAGSPRSGVYGNISDAEMQAVRQREQQKAAYIGDYSLQIQLAHPSTAVKNPSNADVQVDLVQIFSATHPEVVYLHQPADKHDTHLAVLSHSIAALRKLPRERLPQRIVGCEVWRDLDWLCDADKVVLDVSAFPNIAASLVGVFDSQISGGKRYDLATTGRRLAHATFHTSHATDKYTGITWAMDLTPLVHDSTVSMRDYARDLIGRFQRDVDDRLAKYF